MSRRRGYVHACPAFQHKSSGSSSRTCERSQPQAFYCSQTLIDVENSDTKCHCILFLRLCPSTCAYCDTFGSSLVPPLSEVPLFEGFKMITCPDVGAERSRVWNAVSSCFKPPRPPNLAKGFHIFTLLDAPELAPRC